MAKYLINNLDRPIDFEAKGAEEERIVQNCKNLLMAKQGEIPYDRLMGFSRSLMDKPVKELNGEILRALDKLMRYEPRATVTEARAYVEDPAGEVIIECVIDTEV